MMHVTIKKLTDVKLLQCANSFTTGRDSHMTLARAYRHGHSPIRTQLFWVECREIPLFVASQLVRSHVGVQFFQLSKRPDRGGSDLSSVCATLADDITFPTTQKIVTKTLLMLLKSCAFCINALTAMRRLTLLSSSMLKHSSTWHINVCAQKHRKKHAT